MFLFLFFSINAIFIQNKVVTTKEEEEEEAEKEAEESTEEVFHMLDRKNKKSLKYKRSFFVRMVSDPKIYNPKIVRSLPAAGNRRHTTSETSEENNVSVGSPTIDLDILTELLKDSNLKKNLKDQSNKHTLLTKTSSDVSERILWIQERRTGEISK